MNVLVIAAHPDDEVLGAGGSIARWAAEGQDVAIAILGEGHTSRYDRREDADLAAVEQLHGCSQQVADLLGAKELVMGDLPDNRFDTEPFLDVVKRVEALVERLQPEVVLTQHGGDLNIDHQVIFRATMTATRPMAGRPVKALYAYEVASSTEWAFQQFEPHFRPSVFVDISATLETKVAAMGLYESEDRAFPHPRSADALRAASRRWGSVVGLQAAEPLDLIWSIK